MIKFWNALADPFTAFAVTFLCITILVNIPIMWVAMVLLGLYYASIKTKYFSGWKDGF